GDGAGRRPGPAPPRLRAVGPAAVVPPRQRPPLGPEVGPAAGPGAVAARAGCGAGVDPPGPAAAQRRRRAGQRRDPAVGRAGGLRGPAPAAGAAGPRVRGAAGPLPIGLRPAPIRGAPRAAALGPPLPPRGRGAAVGPGPRRPVPVGADALPP